MRSSLIDQEDTLIDYIAHYVIHLTIITILDVLLTNK